MEGSQHQQLVEVFKQLESEKDSEKWFEQYKQFYTLLSSEQKIDYSVDMQQKLIDMSRKVDNRKKLLVSKINSAKLKSECEKLQELLKKTINSLRNQDEHEPQDFSSRIQECEKIAKEIQLLLESDMLMGFDEKRLVSAANKILHEFNELTNQLNEKGLVKELDFQAEENSSMMEDANQDREELPDIGENQQYQQQKQVQLQKSQNKNAGLVKFEAQVVTPEQLELDKQQHLSQITTKAHQILAINEDIAKQTVEQKQSIQQIEENIQQSQVQVVQTNQVIKQTYMEKMKQRWFKMTTFFAKLGALVGSAQFGGVTGAVLGGYGGAAIGSAAANIVIDRKAAQEIKQDK